MVILSDFLCFFALSCLRICKKHCLREQMSFCHPAKKSTTEKRLSFVNGNNEGVDDSLTEGVYDEI